MELRFDFEKCGYRGETLSRIEPGQRPRVRTYPSHFFSPSVKVFRKSRWLLWLEGTGHRTCLAVQQQRLR